MTPTRCHENEINSSRPPSLKLGVVKQPRRHVRAAAAPVIIYAQSPKVIHTRKEDFMALVQRLTGLDEEIIIKRSTNDVSESSSSVVTEDDTTAPFSEERQQQRRRRNVADIPLFTPSSMTLFGSPTQLRYLSPNRTDPVSPSVFKFIEE